MAETLKKLLTIKSIVTLALTAVFCVLCVTGVISGSEFLTVFATVIAFYFGTQTTKNVKAADVEAIHPPAPADEKQA